MKIILILSLAVVACSAVPSGMGMGMGKTGMMSNSHDMKMRRETEDKSAKPDDKLNATTTLKPELNVTETTTLKPKKVERAAGEEKVDDLLAKLQGDIAKDDKKDEKKKDDKKEDKKEDKKDEKKDDKKDEKKDDKKDDKKTDGKKADEPTIKVERDLEIKSKTDNHEHDPNCDHSGHDHTGHPHQKQSVKITTRAVEKADKPLEKPGNKTEEKPGNKTEEKEKSKEDKDKLPESDLKGKDAVADKSLTKRNDHHGDDHHMSHDSNQMSHHDSHQNFDHERSGHGDGHHLNKRSPSGYGGEVLLDEIAPVVVRSSSYEAPVRVAVRSSGYSAPALVRSSSYDDEEVRVVSVPVRSSRYRRAAAEDEHKSIHMKKVSDVLKAADKPKEGEGIEVTEDDLTANVLNAKTKTAPKVKRATMMTGMGMGMKMNAKTRMGSGSMMAM